MNHFQDTRKIMLNILRISFKKNRYQNH